MDEFMKSCRFHRYSWRASAYRFEPHLFRIKWRSSHLCSLRSGGSLWFGLRSKRGISLMALRWISSSSEGLVGGVEEEKKFRMVSIGMRRMSGRGDD